MKKNEYPVGTRVIFNSLFGDSKAKLDNGKVGTIVSVEKLNSVIIYLPESEHISIYSTLGKPASWECGWGSIELAPPQKGEQLEFAFMKEE